MHQIEEWVPDAVTISQFQDVVMFLDFHMTSHLPYSGGMMDQPSRFVSVRRILSGVMGDIKTAERMLAEAQRNNGWQTRR